MAWALDYQNGNWVFTSNDTPSAREELSHQWASLLALQHLACPGLALPVSESFAADADHCIAQLSAMKKPLVFDKCHGPITLRSGTKVYQCDSSEQR